MQGCLCLFTVFVGMSEVLGPRSKVPIYAVSLCQS